MESLLDNSLCDLMYDTLNHTTIFSYDEELKTKHSQVCAVFDRLRHATAWVNTHQQTPQGQYAPTGLMTFMMFASLVKDSIENLRKAFGVSSVLFDAGRPESHQFFSDVCVREPLNIPYDSCPTDDGFFQYFRSLVFADTLVPWTIEWLFHYEIWLATGTWCGGGEHPVVGKKRPFVKKSSRC